MDSYIWILSTVIIIVQLLFTISHRCVRNLNIENINYLPIAHTKYHGSWGAKLLRRGVVNLC
jgi:hypothetical protein